MLYFGDKFNEAEARKINITDKAAQKLLEIAESKRTSVRILPVQGSVLLTFDRPKQNDMLFTEHGVPVLVTLYKKFVSDTSKVFISVPTIPLFPPI